MISTSSSLVSKTLNVKEYSLSILKMSSICLTIKAVRDEHFHNLRNQGIALKPGFDALFDAIKQHDLLTAIVTSSHLPEVKHNFSGSTYLAQFDLVITAEDVERGKPNPDCYQMAHRHQGVDAKQCLVLEDSNNGIKAALAAECQAVMIPDLLPPLPEFEDKVIIKVSLEGVIPLLSQL